MFNSQVLEFYEKMNKKINSGNVITKLIVLGSIKDYFNKSYFKQRNMIKRKINNSCFFSFKIPYSYNMPRFLSFNLILNAVICFLVLYIVLRLKKTEPAICHCRTELGSYILLKLKRYFFKNIKVICDCRGLGSKEIMYIPSIKKKALLSEKIFKIEKFVHLNSDYLLCVTNVFKKYIIEETKNKIKNISVVPCCLDTKKFKYDPKLRKKIRNELRIKDEDFALLYSGSFNRWQLPNRMIEIYKIFKEKISNSLFVVLTKDTEYALNLLTKTGLDEKSFRIIFKPYNEINKYLLAGDIGLLIREDNDVNRIAFPIKFPEYIRSGVPVLTSISSDVIDIVKDLDLGFILKDYKDNKELIRTIEDIKKVIGIIKNDEYKRKISDSIMEKVEWDGYIKSVIKIYETIMTNNL